MKPSARLVIVTVVVALALSGCVRVQIDLEITPEDTVNGAMVFALQEGVGELVDTTDEEAAEQLFGDAELGFDDAAVTPYEQDGYVGQMVTFEDQPLGDLKLATGDFTVARDGDNYVVDGVVDKTTQADQEDIPEGAQMQLSVTFPGEVSEHNGTLEGRTVTWDLTSAPDELHAVGAAEPTSSAPIWLSPAIGIALLVGVAIVLVVALRRRGAAPASTSGKPGVEK